MTAVEIRAWGGNELISTAMAIGDNMSGVIEVRLVRLPDSKLVGATTLHLPDSQPSWQVQYLDHDVYEGDTYVQTTGDERNPSDYSGNSTRGAINRRTHLINVGGNAEGARTSVSVDGDASGALIRDNVFAKSGSRYWGNGLDKAVVVE